MKIYFGADHNGFELKVRLMEYVRSLGYDVEDDGDQQLDPADDFPQFAARVVAALEASDNADPRAILICGSGQGMCMSANRFKGVRAALCWDETSARSARNDDDSNVLCLPARQLEVSKAEAIAKVWLETSFAGADRFKRRIKEMDELGN
jgi:ribose 5-phosphate isomerase B